MALKQDPAQPPIKERQAVHLPHPGPTYPWTPKGRKNRKSDCAVSPAQPPQAKYKLKQDKARLCVASQTLPFYRSTGLE